MKTHRIGFIASLLIFLSLAFSDETLPYRPYYYGTFEHRSEANGYVTTWGPAYGTSIGLSPSSLYGDSAVVGFVNHANDTDNVGHDVHRSYIIPRFFGHPVGDSVSYKGQSIQCPCFIQFWYKVQNMTLHGRPVGIDDWNSLITLTPDSSDLFFPVVTVNEDTLQYVYLFHVPSFGQATHTYQAGPSNDPTGKKKLTRNKWHLIQQLYDNRVTHRTSVWINGMLTSSANLADSSGHICQFHAGLYCSPAVSSGTVLNDDMIIVSVIDSLDAAFRYMAMPPGR